MGVCMYVCMYVYMYVCVFVHVDVPLCVCVRVFVNQSEVVQHEQRMSIHVFGCIYVYMHVFNLYVYTFLCT